jgi:hypothetical protein
MYWWWDSYIEPLNLWYRFDHLNTFLDGLDLATYQPTPVSVLHPADQVLGEDQKVAAEALGMASSDDYLVWVRSNAYTAAAVSAAHDAAVRDALRNRQTLGEFAYNPPLVNEHLLQLVEISSGLYRVEWFNPQTGEWGETSEHEATVDGLVVPLPTFSKDIAARITLLR